MKIFNTVQKASTTSFLILSLSILFCFFLFKNISYPLLWGDEAETAITANQILHHGYPKVHEGKNIIFLPDIAINIHHEENINGLPDSTNWIGYKPSIDANISMPWGNYYFATIGVFIASHFNDMYLKTALVRIPFAAIGLIGLMIFMLALKGFFPSRTNYHRFIIAFIFLELFSITLLLNMRQARYYSLVIFITGCFFYVFIHYFILRKYSFKKYLFMMTLVLFLGYQVSFVLFTVLCITAFVYEAWFGVMSICDKLKNRQKFLTVISDQFLQTLRNISPVLIAIIIVIPFLIYFEIFSISSKATQNYGFSFVKYKGQLERLLYILKTQECFYPFVVAKVSECIVLYLDRNKNKQVDEMATLKRLSFFMTIFFISFALIIGRWPMVLFTRHFIVLQPVMILIMLTDIFIVLKYLSDQEINKVDQINSIAKFARVAFLLLLILAFSSNLKAKINYERNYLFQITHQVKGPLDYTIPYIKENFKKPEDLVLAADYEEFSYIYYLDCKVVLGYTNKNLKDDLNYQPDLMIYRKEWKHDRKYFDYYAQKAKYNRILFPVYDSGVNDITELNWAFSHQFKTKFTTDDNEKAELLVLEK